MIHTLTHEFTQTIRGMKVSVKVKAPQAADVEPLLAKFREAIVDASENPDQFNLPLAQSKED